MRLIPISTVSTGDGTLGPASVAIALVPSEFHPGLLAFSLAVGAVVIVGRCLFLRSRTCWPLALLVVPIVLLQIQQRAVPFAMGVVAAAVAVGGHYRRGETDDLPVGVLVWVSLVGVWLAVPDTEPALIAGAFLALALAGGALLAPHYGDRVAGIGLLVCCAWAGSAGRPELIGGLGCVGMLAASVPSSVTGRRAGRVAVLLVHAALCLLFSRKVTSLGWGPAMLALGALAGVGALSWLAFGQGRRADLATEGPSALG